MSLTTTPGTRLGCTVQCFLVFVLYCVFSALLCMFAVQAISITSGLECYSCTNVTALKYCKPVVPCPANSVCHMELVIAGTIKQYTLGCANQSHCQAIGNSSNHQPHGGSGSLVGRSTSSKCAQCCHSSNCNRQLCQTADPFCSDTSDFDCKAAGAAINVCADIRHARHSCRRFCGLCNMVDGGWASWSGWSSCDVTCGNGTQRRIRTCTNPAPADGGEDCVGTSLETGECSLDKCPIHGGWSKWSSWGSCSNTCDIGMQRRERTCSNPHPSRFGDNCYGESRDDRLCLPGACADGQWSAWNTWGTCSASCGYGTRKRSRSCDNPAPSIVGRTCTGDAGDTELCHIRSCPDGQWSAWNTWGTCSASCGYGIRKRSRSCDNPAPSIVGRTCTGDAGDTELCHIRSCPAIVSAFTATNPTGSGWNPVIFGFTKVNEGDSYNNSTGVFRCKHQGLYYFSVDLTKVKDTSNPVGVIGGYIMKNGNIYTTISIDPTDDDTDKGSYSATGSAILHLVKGDTVKIWLPIGKVENWSTFSGFLISPDP